jgi:hypothetical protein
MKRCWTILTTDQITAFAANETPGYVHWSGIVSFQGVFRADYVSGSDN